MEKGAGRILNRPTPTRSLGNPKYPFIDSNPQAKKSLLKETIAKVFSSKVGKERLPDLLVKLSE